GGFITSGTLVTNAAGAGAAGISVPAAVLQGSPFGPGFRNDHLDLIGSDPRTSILSIGAINYFVCRRAAGAVQGKTPAGMETGVGDPLERKGGSKVKISKAKAKAKKSR